MSQQRQTSLAGALRTARRARECHDFAFTREFRHYHAGSHAAKEDRHYRLFAFATYFNATIVYSIRVLQRRARRSSLSSTPLEEGRENGFTLDTETADTDFAVLLSALRHVLYPVSFPEFFKLLDLEHNYDFYHVVLTEIIFTVLPIVLRGTALSLYSEAARSHPGDGRYILQRIRYEIEGVPDSDTATVTGSIARLRAAAGGPVTPTAKPHPADLALHPARTDFTWDSEEVAMLGFVEGDAGLPAFRETTWIPSPAINNPALKHTIVDQD
ncbi:hypothetical protein CYMTET_7434 [Cymbomonas tetramitiformis]|uniref:Uncharacterized protein n=1 Tax=Cymbomonas tetramitiformis TaxID=36881 RepID=A0AAE0GVH7_9CHLO|nr:hypothetical protein CYMTET_7434 [Cymbomonas tetramitiformis]